MGAMPSGTSAEVDLPTAGTDGTGLRRQFDLPEEDEDAVATLGLAWETVVVRDGGGEALWLLVHEYPVPNGFVCETSAGLLPADHVLVGVRVTGYPGGKLDMAYFYPPLRRADGKAIPSVGDLAVDGKAMQQWSRHYSAANPFRVGVDTIGTHLRVMDEWLQRELLR